MILVHASPVKVIKANEVHNIHVQCIVSHFSCTVQVYENVIFNHIDERSDTFRVYLFTGHAAILGSGKDEGREVR